MTRGQIQRAIFQALQAGHLADIAGQGDLADAAVLVENHLADRLPPLRPWQKRAGVTPLTKEALNDEIRREFRRLFDQLKTPRKLKTEAEADL